MFKKILAVQILTGLLCFTLAACADNSGSSQTESTQQSDSASSEQTAQPTESGSDSSADSSAEQSSDTDSTSDSTGEALSENVTAPEDMFTERDLSGEYSDYSEITLSDSGCNTTADGVSISGSTVTITQKGTYLISGTLSDGQIIVSAPDTDKVQLVLNGASITKKGSAAIYITEADKVFITTVEGTNNTLASAGEFVQTDDNTVDGAVFSKADIIFNGKGTLDITCESGHGAVTKDDLKITGGTYNITSASKGLSGKDSVRIAGGSITVNSGTDAIHSENTEDTAKGYVYICGGSLDLTSGGDGISASGTLTVDGGSFKIVSGGGASQQTQGYGSADDSSYKGLKSSTDLVINGGELNIDSRDDALHSNNNVTVRGGTLEISTGDDGIHADNITAITDGTINIAKSYEGIEGLEIDISGGKISLVSSDDGLNAAGGNDGSGWGGGMKQDMFAAQSGALINISGGEISITAEGDGVDSNGNLTVSGGTTYVSGPTNSGNGSLDYNGTATITGGVFIAAGSSGMAQNFGTESTQGSILCNFTSGTAGSEITLTDENGKILASFTPAKSYQTVIISAPEIEVGKTYTVTVGEQSQEISMTSIIYGASGQGGFGGGGHGGGGFEKPGRFGDMGDMDRMQQPAM